MLKAYPRPQFRREQWDNLNGEWQFAFDDNSVGEKEKWVQKFPAGKMILVPYNYETKMSGIGDETFHPVVWYQRTVTLKKQSGRLLLHFEGCDYHTKVWLNGCCVGMHTGAYAAFCFDVTDYAVEGENTLTVRAEDSLSCVQPRGKQRWRDENFGCWYVQTTGIWKTVWMENVPETYLEKVKMTPDIDAGTVECHAKIHLGSAKEIALRCEVRFEDKLVCSQTMQVTGEMTRFTLNLLNQREMWELKLWSPRNPKLYDISLFCGEDAVESYVGMRKISIEGNQVLLNNKPLYQRLILDQGYWEDSHLTPPSDEAYDIDLDAIVAAGYNGLRKHQKTEDRRFLALCDKRGILVWSEMAAQYAFGDEVVSAFTKEWMELVEQNYNHPSVIVWTPFNESWGVEQIRSDVRQQQLTEAIYHLTKAYDLMRPVIVNDGWEHTVSDILTLHDYEADGECFKQRYARLDDMLGNRIPFIRDRYAMVPGYAYRGQPIIISEYGGIAFTSEKGWGYGEQVRDEEAFLKRFDSITSAIKENPAFCGFCYTQVSDVQQEVNGLYTMKRKPKVSIEAISRINKK